jgi:hypothetical protein
MANNKKEEAKPSLSREEEVTLKKCEEIIDAGLKTLFEVGKALQTIQLGKLYRLTHSTFQSYVQERFQISLPWAYKLMEAAKVVGDFKGENLNTNQAAALAKVDPNKRKTVLNKAKASAKARGKRVTARDIHNANGKKTTGDKYTLEQFAKELGGLVNKAKAEGLPLVVITDTIGAIHGSLVRLCKEQSDKRKAA